MNSAEPAFFETDAAILSHLLKAHDIDFENLQEKGCFYPSEEPVILWEDLAFPTPSGKIKLASNIAAQDGHSRTPSPEPLARPTGKRLRLLTPADEWHMNSSYDNDPRILERTREETLTLHPEDAAARGLTDGAAARVWNEAGELSMRIALSDKTPPGVGWAPKRPWPGQSQSGLNVNALNPGLRSDIGDSTALHGVESEVEAAS